MQITFQVNFHDVAPHLSRDQYGGLVAYIMQLKGFHSVRLWKTLAEVSLNVEETPWEGSADDFKAYLMQELHALLKLEILLCPCGCLKPIFLKNCMQVDQGDSLVMGLNSVEMEAVKQGQIIQAIRSIRHRTGKSMNEAKMMVINYRASIGLAPPSVSSNPPWKPVTPP